MIIIIFSCLLILLLSNAITLRQDKSILYSRISFFIVLYTILVSYSMLDFLFTEKTINLYNGLLYCKNHTMVFSSFIYIVTAIILLLTCFYPRASIPLSTYVDNVPMDYIVLSFARPIYRLFNYLGFIHRPRIFFGSHTTDLIDLKQSNITPRQIDNKILRWKFDLYESLIKSPEPADKLLSSKVIMNIIISPSQSENYRLLLARRLLAWLSTKWSNIQNPQDFRLNIKSDQYTIIEYPLLILFVITGGTFLISSSDLITVFLSIELQSYGLYLLCTIYRNSELSTNAGLTYFLLGGVSSCLILLGQSLLYVNSGNTCLDCIYILNNILTYDTNILQSINYSLVDPTLEMNLDAYYIQLSMIILATGFLFKISASPFHSWSPDVYDAIPTLVTTFVAIIAKISVFIFLLDLVYYTSSSPLSISWKTILLISSLLSLIIGSVLGLTQIRIKRLFAYSTVSHVGFILLSLSITSIESTQAFYFYIIQYSLTNLNGFFILIAMGYTYIYLENYNNINNLDLVKVSKNLANKQSENKESTSPIQFISQIRGFFYINPFLTISLAICLYSLIGIPPLLGFFSKQMVLSAALDSGYIFISLIAILTSVISAVYYLGVIKQLFFGKNRFYNLDNTITLSSSLTSSISMLTIVLIIFMFIPEEIMYITCIISI